VQHQPFRLKVTYNIYSRRWYNGVRRSALQHELREDQMIFRLPRALIMAHYDPHGLNDTHVLYSLEAYRRVFDHITFVSVSADRLPIGREGLVDTFIFRENVGYDFFSWKIGFNALVDKERFFEIIFTNDSIYGPLFDIEHALLAPRVKEAEFWGLTSSMVPNWHIQSYFFSMRHRLLISSAARDYWDAIRSFKNKGEVINACEMRMADYFRSRNWLTEVIYEGPSSPPFRWHVTRLGTDLRQPINLAKYLYYNLLHSDWRLRKQNPMNYLWRSAIEAGVPFIKVELLRANPLMLPLQPIHDYISRNTRYPLDLIFAHLRRTARISA